MTTTATPTPARTHGDLDCADAEALLHDATSEVSDLRARLGLALQGQDDMAHQTELLRVESDRLRALLDDVSRKNHDLVEERDGLREQVKILNEELAVVEADAVPEGTLVYGLVARDHLIAEYRAASRIRRGPVPPSVIEAANAARNDIAEAMALTGREAVTALIRREVRRRRRTQTRTATRTPRSTRTSR